MPQSSALKAREPCAPLQHDLFARRPRRAPPALEFATHVMVAEMLDRWASTGWRWTHIASGELRDKVTAARLKRMGVKPGWPDFILISNLGVPHFLELKRRRRTLSPAQEEFARWCVETALPHAVCDGFDKALAALKMWGALRVEASA